MAQVFKLMMSAAEIRNGRIHSFFFISIKFISILRVMFCGRTIERTICLLFKKERNLGIIGGELNFHYAYNNNSVVQIFFVTSIHNVFKIICAKFLPFTV